MSLKTLEEIKKMSDIPLPLMEIIEKFGLPAKWEAKAKAEEREEARKYFLNLLDQGLSVDEIKLRLNQSPEN